MKNESIGNLDGIFDNLEAGIILVDSNHHIRWMNQKVKEWFGPLKLGEKRKCHRTEKYNENFCRICPTRKTINFGIPTRYEINFPQKETPCNFEIISLPITKEKDTNPFVMEFILNKSQVKIDKKESKDIIAHMEKMASIGNLAAGIAHELNTPLATISIISQELKDIFNKKDCSKKFKEEIIEYLFDIDVEIKRCVSIIDDVQNFSRKGLQKKKPVSIARIILKTVDLIRKGKLSEGIVIKKDLGTLPPVNTDPERFRQVILNILKNAVEAVSAAGRKKKEITISLKKKKESIIAIIKDTGPGIPKMSFEKLFEPFFTTKPVGKGTGLGLFVSYGIMKDLGGDIQIKSSMGRGTSVHLILPFE